MKVIIYPERWHQGISDSSGDPKRKTLAALLNYIAEDIREVGCPLAVNLTLAAASCLMEAANDLPSEG